jgi:AmmeMemoRadiSam system protein B
MNAIETGSHTAFTSAITDTGNTVCGRHPIAIMMAMVEEWKKSVPGAESKGLFKFVRYERSSIVSSPDDSSVSYCSAYAIL